MADPNFDDVELNVDNTSILWKMETDNTWKELAYITSLLGDKKGMYLDINCPK
ncbi:MAG: hypothetical protein ABH890_04465 [Bacillota bacterium]